MDVKRVSISFMSVLTSLLVLVLHSQGFQVKAEEVLLAEYTSRFDSGNKNRTNNLIISSKAINGTVINPGNIFSFNQVVGIRTTGKGYKEATVFGDGGTEYQGIGGGICQVSSTIYNVDLMLAEIQTVERHPHVKEVTYVPKKQDAAVQWNSQDYRFKNVIDVPVKLYISVDNSISRGKLTVRLYKVTGGTGNPSKETKPSPTPAQTAKPAPTPTPAPAFQTVNLNLCVGNTVYTTNQVFLSNKTNRVLVPFRYIAERLNWTADWNQSKMEASISNGYSVVVLPINKQVAYVNGTAVQIDEPASIIWDKTYVPARFVADYLGLSVEWDEQTKTVTLRK